MLIQETIAGRGTLRWLMTAEAMTIWAVSSTVWFLSWFVPLSSAVRYPPDALWDVDTNRPIPMSHFAWTYFFTALSVGACYLLLLVLVDWVDSRRGGHTSARRTGACSVLACLLTAIVVDVSFTAYYWPHPFVDMYWVPVIALGGGMIVTSLFIGGVVAWLRNH